MPRCTTEAMGLHLEEIAQAVAPDAHAVLPLDQAAWHTTKKLRVPANITLLPLPARSPELNPVDNLWQFMRDNWATASSNPIPTSSTTAATPGTPSSTDPGASCPSDCANGLMRSDQ
jgi:hypothetical protein